jgi:ankyrin repeat protein
MTTLRATLNSLPLTLDETYSRILHSINDTDQPHVLHILQWVCFSVRPLLVEELAVVYNVGDKIGPPFNVEDSLFTAELLVDVCRGLLIVTTLQMSWNFRLFNPRQPFSIVELAHFSVKEYLLSSRAGPWYIDERLSHIHIMKAAIAIFLGVYDDRLERFSTFPVNIQAPQRLLATYGPIYASTHLTHLTQKDHTDLTDSFRLLLSPQLCNLDTTLGALYFPYSDMDPDPRILQLPICPYDPPAAALSLNLAARLGLTAICQSLLASGAHSDINTFVPGYNAGPPLLEASEMGHADIVALLLTQGADVNKEGRGLTAIHIASFAGHVEIVQLLINHQVDPNAAGNFAASFDSALFRDQFHVAHSLLLAGASSNDKKAIGNTDLLMTKVEKGHTGVHPTVERWRQRVYPLALASANGHKEVVKMLIDAGADPNRHSGPDNSPLYEAASKGHTEIVRLLLDAGASIASEDGLYTAVMALAACNGRKEIVQLLADAGVDPNGKTEGDYRRSLFPLYEASRYGYPDIVLTLLEAGADVNLMKMSETPLQVASRKGHEDTARILIAYGADVNKAEEAHLTPLQLASRMGHKKVVGALIENGADLNVVHHDCGTALQAAALEGYEEIVQWLIIAGADVNLEGGKYGTALQAASSRGHSTIITLLLSSGADPNAKGGEFGSAIEAAAFGGHTDIVKALMDVGADVNMAFDVACLEGHAEVVKVLLNGSVAVDIDGKTDDGGSEYGTPLQTVTYWGYNEIAHALIVAGADVNRGYGRYGPPLQIACRKGREEMVAKLLASGANVNALGGLYGSAIQAAAAGGHEGIVKILVGSGADVNVSGGWEGTALQLAARGGHKEAVQLLVEAGADVTVGGKYGTATQIASQRGYEYVVDILVSAGATAPERKVPKSELN